MTPAPADLREIAAALRCAADHAAILHAIKSLHARLDEAETEILIARKQADGDNAGQLAAED